MVWSLLLNTARRPYVAKDVAVWVNQAFKKFISREKVNDLKISLFWRNLPRTQHFDNYKSTMEVKRFVI